MARSSVESTRENYDKDNARLALVRAQARDIGEIPKTRNKRRRSKCRKDLLQFIKTYLPDRFPLDFSQAHLDTIKKLEYTVLNNGLFAIAHPRGNGKTTMVEASALWATLYAHRKYVVVIGSDQSAAQQILDSIKAALSDNDRLLEDFPEVCYPIHKLENIPLRANGQTADGKATNMCWKGDIVRYATLPRRKTSGTILEAKGLTGRLRGMKSPSGLRPDYVLLDDPQTDESANSDSQCLSREKLIKSTVLGLGGGSTGISGVMTCTVIRRGDLAERFLDHEQNPEWRGVRYQLLETEPEDKKHWEEYYDMRRKETLADAGHEKSNKFYEDNQEVMDKGAKACWEERKLPDEVSAIQHAMNLKTTVGDPAFASEYQNQPSETYGSIYTIESSQVEDALNGHKRGEIPDDAHYVVMGVDINHYALNWAVVAATNDMVAYVVDYGQYPQGRPLWEQGCGMTEEQAIQSGIMDLCQQMERRNHKIRTMLPDGNYCTEAVYKAAYHADKLCKATVVPARGLSGTKYSPPYRKSDLIVQGTRAHLSSNRRGRNVIFDSHYWHRHLQQGLLLAPGIGGSVSLWDNKKLGHGEYAAHICADRLMSVSSKNGQEEMKWMHNPGEHNDLGDATAIALAGCTCMGASQHAVEVRKKRKKKKTVTFNYG